jgi:replicative DNA helicase
MKDVSDRQPPNDLEAERVVLGMVLYDRDTYDTVSTILQPEHFWSDAYRIIYSEAQSCRSNGAQISYISICAGLRDKDLLDAVGGDSFVHALAKETAYIHNVEDLAKRVRQKWRQRRLIETCQKIAAEGYYDVGDVDEWINKSEAALHAIAQDSATVRLTTMHEALGRAFNAIASCESKDISPGLSSGIDALDHVMGPMRRGQIIVIGALSGVGKTSLATNMAVHNGRQGVGVLIFSAEMVADELATRVLFTEARVDSSKVNKPGALTPRDFQLLTDNANRVGLRNIWIDDRSSLSPNQIRSVVRRTQAREPSLGLIVIDYLQLLNGKEGMPKNATRENEMSEVARQMKVLAKESGLPVIALAQLNSDSEKVNAQRKPRMNDLRESKALAMNADKIVLIHNSAAIARAEAYRTSANGEFKYDLSPELVDLIVAKNRGGQTGTVPALFQPSFTLFEEATASDLEEFRIAALKANKSQGYRAN